MEYGVVFPQLEIGTDPGVIRGFAQAVEGLGYSDLLIYDHVLGADTQRRPGWSGYYTSRDMFHEPFVLYGYLAAVTQRIRLVTGIIILPQRQTVLVAKQTAEVDVLSGGRLSLGIGVGWNDVEFEALSEDFHNRGRRCEEQVAVLRALWTQEIVDFEGRWHRINGAGLNPLPIQRPIPIWFGGDSEPVLKRIARIGDGWLVEDSSTAKGMADIERLRSYTREAGRDPSSLEIGVVVELAQGDIDSQLAAVQEWQHIGATRVYAGTMGAGFASVDDHIEAISTFKSALDQLN